MLFRLPAFSPSALRPSGVLVLLALPLLTLAPPVAAQNLYRWDANGAAPGAGGPAPSGIWATDAANWTFADDGTLGTFAWTNGKFARFATGGDATGSYTVTVAPGGIAAGGIFLQRGTLLLTGGVITLTPNPIASPGNIMSNGSGLTISSVLAGTERLTVNGSGSITFTGANTYSGGTTVSDGKLFVSSAANLGTGAVDVTSGTLTGTSGLQFDRAVTVSGANSVLTANANLEFGANAAGSLAIAAGGRITAATSVTFGLSAGGTGTGSLTGAGSRLTTGTTLSLGDSGSGSLTVADGATLATSVLRFGNGVSGSGTLQLNAGGTLEVGGTDGIARGAGGAAFNLAGGTVKVSGSPLTTSVPATLTNTSTIDTNGLAATLAGVLSGSGGLTKAGAGTLTLSGANTYAGGTTVAAGTLAISSAANLGSGAVNVAGGTLAGTGSFDYNLNVTIAGSSSILTASEHLGFSQSLAITNGGQSSAVLGLAFGAGAGSNATGSITGAGSRLTSGAKLLLGYFGNATLTIADGGTAAAETLIFAEAGGNSTLNLNTGGTLEVGGTQGIRQGAGTNVFNFAGGTLKITGSDLTTSQAFTLTNTSTIDTNGFAATHSGVLSGSGALTKAGAGTLTLSGNNTYAGATSVSAGTLAVSSAAQLGSGAIDVTGGTLTSTGALILNRAVSLTGSSALLSVPTSYLEVGRDTAGSLTASLGGKVTTGQSAAFGILSAGTGTVTGTGSSLTIGSTLFLGFYGNGTLTVADGGAVTTTALLLGHETGGTGTLQLNSGGTLTTGNYVEVGKNGTGLLDLASGGTLHAAASVAFGLNAGATGTGSLTGAGTRLATDTILFLGYGGAGSLTVADGATLVAPTLRFGNLTGAAGTLHLNAGGTLEVGGTDGIARGAGGAAFNLAGGIVKVTGAALTTSVPVTLTNTSTVDTNGLGATVFGVLSGSGSLTKTGAGTLTLSAANTYAGNTTVSAGMLQLGAAGSLANTTGITVGSGAVFDVSPVSNFTLHSGQSLGGNGSIEGLVTLGGGAHLRPGSSPGTLTFNDGLTLTSGSFLDFELGLVSDKILVTDGILTGSASANGITLNLTNSGGFAAGTYVLFDFTGADSLVSFDAADFLLGTPIAGYDFAFNLTGSTLELVATSAIPEPSTYALCAGLAMLGLALFRRCQPPALL